METYLCRGYALPLAARYALGHEGLKPRLSSEAIEYITHVANTKPAVWVPREDVIRLWSYVDEASPDEESAYQNLVRGGEVVSDEALSTFLRLLLRVLSPSRFAKKFPDIWAHENKGGHVEASVDDKSMLILIHDVEGFKHVGPVATGFVSGALKALGLKDLKLRDVTWSRKTSAPRDVRIEISWS